MACIIWIRAFLSENKGCEMIVNGVEIRLEKPITVKEYLEENGYRIETVVVELDMKILPKEEYGNTQLKDESRMEIVHFMGGG